MELSLKIISYAALVQPSSLSIFMRTLKTGWLGSAVASSYLGGKLTDRLRGDADVLHGRLNHVNSKGFRGI